MAAHVLLPWVHRVFANAKRWALVFDDPRRDAECLCGIVASNPVRNARSVAVLGREMLEEDS
jgi:hypothetical protein